MSKYLEQAAGEIANPPQSRPLNEHQVKNSAGGFVFAVDDWKRLDRFLVLGSEGGSYYASERDLTVENIEAVKRCVASDGVRTVARIVEISDAGRAPKNDPALLALAYAASKGDLQTRQAALLALPKVARISTHLFHFITYVRKFRGWGRGLREAVNSWYTERTPDQLAHQVVKYQQRDGWSHRDLFRLTHINFKKLGREYQAIAKWVVKGETSKSLPELIDGHIALQVAKNPKSAAKIIREYGMFRESVPTEYLKAPEVWEALMVDMPMTAMIRNLGNMGKCGLLAPLSDASKYVSERLHDQANIKKSRVHPIQILVATQTYANGRGVLGKGEWTPVTKVVNALTDAFYLAFANVEPTGKNFYIGLDISGSMWGGSVADVPDLPPAVAAGALALVTVKSEENNYVAGFTCTQSGRYGGRWDNSNTAMTPIAMSKNQRLDAVLKNMQALQSRMGGTDCALPMLDALEKKIPVDVFYILTDSETWAGKTHPTVALQLYRNKMGRDAKLVVAGLVSNGFTIADPSDSGQMDIVGFDTHVPNLIAEFAKD